MSRTVHSIVCGTIILAWKMKYLSNYQSDFCSIYTSVFWNFDPQNLGHFLPTFPSKNLLLMILFLNGGLQTFDHPPYRASFMLLMHYGPFFSSTSAGACITKLSCDRVSFLLFWPTPYLLASIPTCTYFASGLFDDCKKILVKFNWFNPKSCCSMAEHHGQAISVEQMVVKASSLKHRTSTGFYLTSYTVCM